MSTSLAQQIPPWLAKHTSQSYMYTACRSLADRESEREIARFLSIHPSSYNERASSAPRSKYRLQLPKPSKPEHSLIHYSVAIGQLPENQYRNRYLDVGPYDRTRVVVDVKKESRGGNEDAEIYSNYLNASWVLERFGHKWWIATQAPLPNTTHTFLSVLLRPVSFPPKPMCRSTSSSPRMSRVRTVVQLTKNVESGRRKAHAYFPNEVGKFHVVSPEEGDATPALKVTLLSSCSIEKAHCIHSTIEVTPSAFRSCKYDDGESRDDEDDDREGTQESVRIHHMLYTSWPDHGVPAAEDRASLLAFLQLVDSTNRDTSFASCPDDLDPDPPIVVGCSAGIGRTGSFIALSSLLRSFRLLPAANTPYLPSILPPSPLGTLPHALHEDLVAQEVDSLREQRPGMVQREEQILLIYETLASALNMGVGT